MSSDGAVSQQLTQATPPKSGPTLSDQLETRYDEIGVTGSHRFIIVMVLLGVLFDSIEQNTVGITGPVLKEYADWNITTVHISLLNTVTFISVAIGRLLCGYLADRVGRKSMLMINLAVFSVGSVLCAIAPNYAFLAGSRALVGLGLGGEIAIAVVLISEFFGRKSRGTAVATVNVMAAGFGNVLAPLVGIAIFAAFAGDPNRWRWVFALLAVPAVFILFLRRYVPETPRYLLSKGRVQEASYVLDRLAYGHMMSQPAASARREWFNTSHESVGESEGFARVSPLRIFGPRLLRPTLALGIAVFMTYGAQNCVLTLMPTILADSGMSINNSLATSMMMQLGSLFGAITAAMIARKLPRKLVLTCGGIGGMIAGLLFGWAATGSSNTLLILFGALFNFFVILNNTTIWVFAPEQFPTRIRGMGTAFILACGSLAGGTVPILAAKIVDGPQGLPAMLFMLAGFYAILTIAVQFPKETHNRPLMQDSEL